MKNLKNKFILASAILALASCADNSYLGPETGENGAGGGAISFASGTGSITRATSNTGDDHAKLDNQFKVYGVKNVSNTYSTVFPNYVVFYNANTTTSNPDGDWEYVGTTSTTYGSDNTSLSSTQTIKYWDFAADNYHFVAGSPVSSFTYNITSNDITSATVTGFAGHINANTTSTAITTNPIYIAKPLNLTKTGTTFTTDHEVKFDFVRQQTFVRVGIYETIPGYKITNIKFYPYDETSDAWGSTPTDNIILATSKANFFMGGNNDAIEGTIVYDWTTTPASYTFTYSAISGKSLTQQKSWYGGAYNYAAVTTEPTSPAWEMATSSTETSADKLFGKETDRDNNGYFIVLPTPSATTETPLMIKCDYTLTSDDASEEEIKISGATAAIPAAYSLWKPNFKYTYLFKITDDKLTPITFDAAVIVDSEGNQETITTVPNDNSGVSITTYAKSSAVTTDGEYKEDANIYVAVMDDKANPALIVTGDDTNAKLYTVTTSGAFAGGITEASVANALTGTETSSTWTATDANNNTMTVTAVANGLTVGSTIIADDSPTGVALNIYNAKFTPSGLTADTYYVFEYSAIYTPIASGTSLSGNDYYVINTTNGGFTAGTEAVTADGKTQYQKNTTGIKKYYKVIKVKNSN